MDVLKFRGAGAFAYSPYASDYYDETLYVCPNETVVILDAAHYVTIEAGFVYNGADVPRVVWWLIPPHGKYCRAVQLHDKLCETLTVYSRKTLEPVKITRKQADEYFFKACEVEKVSWLARKAIASGVSSYRVLGRVTKPNIRPNKKEVQEKALLEYWAFEQMAMEL